MNSTLKRNVIIFLLAATAAAVFLLALRPKNTPAPKTGELKDQTALPDIKESSSPKPAPQQTVEPDVKPAGKTVPDKVVLRVPFLVQAPFANWDSTHEEACEEVSLIMVKHYLDKTSIPPEESGDKEILGLIEYENKNGYGPSITLSDLNNIAKKYYGVSSGRVKKINYVLDIKNELAQNRPVIIPAAGKILPNPNFRNGGPNYHMLVITGYENNEFITNDPGTKRGQYFRYKFNDLYNAVHDWDPNNILNGPKNILVFEQ